MMAAEQIASTVPPAHIDTSGTPRSPISVLGTIGVDPPPVAEIVEISERGLAGADAQQIDAAGGQGARDEAAVKLLEIGEREGMRAAALLP